MPSFTLTLVNVLVAGPIRNVCVALTLRVVAFMVSLCVC